MQITHHTEKQIEPINPVNVAATIKGIAPRSFEKTFSGLSSEQIAYGFKLCLDGLTREQIEKGMIQVRDNGYCPDPAMFRKWCLGIKGFASDIDTINASYKGKFAAIANIEAWLSDSTTKITNAEREAYNRVYGMFNQLQWANNYEKAKYYAYEAFKDAYVEVVKEFVAKGESQSIWIEPPKIDKPKYKAIPKNYLEFETEEQKEKWDETKAKLQALVDSGMTVQQASLQLIKGD